MIRSTLWAGRLASALVGGCLLVNTAFAATPLELTLDESIRLALANNPAIKVAEADKEKAVWSVKEAETGEAPSLSLGHTSARGNTSTISSLGILETSLAILFPSPYHSILVVKSKV